MAKGAKLTICQIRSIQAKVKYSILLLQHSLKKLLYFQKVGGLWGAVDISAKSPTSDAPVSSEHTSEHSSQKQSTAQNQ